jgi:hypothetical protein
MSVFALQDGAVHHTYSTYARGTETLMGTYQFLDLAPGAGTRTASSSPRPGGAATTSTARPRDRRCGSPGGCVVRRRQVSGERFQVGGGHSPLACTRAIAPAYRWAGSERYPARPL